MHLLIEGPLMSQTVEVYEIKVDPDRSQEPVHLINTKAVGMNASATNRDFIFLAFMTCMMGSGCMIQLYNYQYEQVREVNLGIREIYTDISFCIDERFLVGSHIDGIVSVINLETDKVDII